MERPWLARYDDSVPESIDYPRIPLHRTLEDSARKYPNQTALNLVLRYVGPMSIGARLSYGQVMDQVNRFASALAALGVRKGDRVALLLPNLPQFVIAFYGALKLGAIVVNTNPTYTGREIEHQLGDAGAETAVLFSPLYARLREVQSRTQVKRVIVTDVSDYVAGPSKALVQRTLRKHGQMVDVPEGEGIYRFRPLLDAHPGPAPELAVDPDDTALFQYTGGTTGVPKAAMLSHHNLVANTIQMRRWLTVANEGDECIVGALPFFHVYGMTVEMSLAVYLGGQLVILPDPRDVVHLMKTIERVSGTIVPGVPAMYVRMINHPDVGRYDLRSVKVCVSGAAPLPMEVQTRFGEISGGRLVEGYGLTEAAPVTHCNPVYGLRKSGSIGVPLPDVEVKLVTLEPDGSGHFAEVPASEPGELALRGPQVMQGYWGRPDETAKTITEDGWLRTGDIARMDSDGYFYIVDRLKDIIIASGFNVVPREVEEVLFEHPKVQEAVVAGVPDAYRGETVKAYVVLRPGETATADELIAFCAERLAPYKVPKQVEFRSELPKTQVGKFLRRVLVEEERKKLGK
jgi:long-chain acyl-CoA synthetase